MKYEELNEVRTLKNRITQVQRKLKALRDLVRPATTKFTRETVGGKSYTCLDVMPRGTSTESQTEMLAVMIADSEKELSALQKKLIETIPALTKKIQAEIADNAEQTLMIYRYVACEYFRDIGFKMGYSERRVYQLHEKAIKKIAVDFS